MELILLPRQDPELEPNDAIPPGMVHREGTPCPFVKGPALKTPGRTCCSISATAAARTFEAFGDKLTVRLMRDSLEVKHIQTLTLWMRNVLVDAGARYRAHRAAAALTAGAGAPSDEAYLDWPPERFEEAVQAANKVMVWYECVARLGFGAHAWY